MTEPRIIAVRVTPKASADRVGSTRQLPNGAEELALYVTAPPEDGKANEAVLRLLAKHLGVPYSCLSVIHGQQSRHKLVRVESRL